MTLRIPSLFSGYNHELNNSHSTRFKLPLLALYRSGKKRTARGRKTCHRRVQRDSGSIIAGGSAGTPGSAACHQRRLLKG
jgi:hypothetical protein